MMESTGGILRVFILVTTVITPVTSQYFRCSGESAYPEGHVYDDGIGATLWSTCNFPNPILDPWSCGRTPSRYWTYHLCDPDRLLSRDEGSAVDVAMQEDSWATPNQCENRYMQMENITIAAALINYIKTPNLTAEDLCVNSCQEILPTLLASERQPTVDELAVNGDRFAEILRQEWQLGSCDNDILILYIHQYKYLSTAVGDLVRPLLPSSTIETLQNYAMRNYFENDQLEEGLIYLTDAYRREVVGFSPAHKLVIIMCSSSLAFVLLLLTALGIGRQTDTLYNTGTASYVAGRLVYIFTFMWVIEGVFVFLTWMQERANIVWIIVPPAACCFLFVLSAIFKPTYDTYQIE